MKKIVAAAAILVLALPILARPDAKAPPVSIQLKDRRGHVAPAGQGTTRTGGGSIDVQQPSSYTMVITMSGAATASDHPCGSTVSMKFDLEQSFEIVFDKPNAKAAKLTAEARIVGLLHGGRKGSASESGGNLSLLGNNVDLMTLGLNGHCVTGCESLSVNDKTGPIGISVGSGTVTLHAGWEVAASHPKAFLGKAASAEFAPEPALDPIWVGGPKDVFHGVGKKDFGFQIIIKVNEE